MKPTRFDTEPRQEIEFIGNGLTDETFNVLCHSLTDRELLSSLQRVDFMDNNLVPKQVRLLVTNLEASNVKEVRFRFNNIGKEGCDALASFVNISPSIMTIDIRGNKLVAADVRKLFKAIGKSTTLVQLNVSNNQLGLEGAEMIKESLAKNTYIRFLDFSSNEIGPSGAQHIAALLFNPASTLHNILLHKNKLHDNGVQKVCDAMRTNKEVVQLVLSCNYATDAAARSVADMLAQNETLLDLDIRFNGFTALGMQTIVADGLANNSCLQSLCLSGNPLGPEGASWLVKGLLENNHTRLERLDVGSCSVGPSGGIHFAKLIARSRTLKELNIADNQLDDESASAIAQATANSISISTLDMSTNSFGEPAALCFLEAVQLNPNLSSLILEGNKLSRGMQNKWKTSLDEWLKKNKAERQTNCSYVNGYSEKSTPIRNM